jgi:hypothetical protein
MIITFALMIIKSYKTLLSDWVYARQRVSDRNESYKED